MNQLLVSLFLLQEQDHSLLDLLKVDVAIIIDIEGFEILRQLRIKGRERNPFLIMARRFVFDSIL